MRKTAFFFLAFVTFVASEPSQAHEERNRPTAALENAPVFGFARPRPAADEHNAELDNPATLPVAGNPFAKIPLNTLSETRDRPLFSQSRRPPRPDPPAPPILAARPPPPPPPTPPKPPAPPFTLLGTVVGVDKRVAIFFDKSTRQETRLQEGNEEGGWRLKSVAPRSVAVEKDGSIVVIDFPRPAHASAATVGSGDAPQAAGAAAEALVGAEDIPNRKPPAPPFALLGTVVGVDKRVAIFFENSTRQEMRLQEGNEEKGWRLKSVAPRAVLVEKDGSIVTIDFSKSSRTSVATVDSRDAPKVASATTEALVGADDIPNRERLIDSAPHGRAN